MKNDNKNDNKDQSTRRKLVKTAALGGGVWLALPNEWVKPVTRGILLPAHAQTSPPEDQPTDCQIDTCEGNYQTIGDQMSFLVCVALSIDAPEEQCEGDHDCVLSIGGQEFPPSSSSQNPDNPCQFLCCWGYTGVERESGEVTVEARAGDTDFCRLSLGSIPDSEEASGALCGSPD